MSAQESAAQAQLRVEAISGFLRDGVSIFPRVATSEILQSVIQSFASATGRPGQRSFELTPSVRRLVARDGLLGELASELVNRETKPVRVLFFDKTPESNWAVPWHQDRVIAVKERVEARGFNIWSLKDGVVHVEPPVTLLENMLTLRLFLDPCDDDNGPLEVACETHLHGRIPSQNVVTVARQSRRFVAVGGAGDVLAMRLLSLHKSERAVKPLRRRVLHIDFAAEDPPKPLRWAVEV
jgi:hypothetical protein